MNMDGPMFTFSTADCECSLEPIMQGSDLGIQGFRSLSSATGFFGVIITMKENTAQECNPDGHFCPDCLPCVNQRSAASQHCAAAHVLAQGGSYDFGFGLGNDFFATANRQMVYSLAARTDVSLVQPRYPGTI
jgi:hypothetical protein